MLSDAGKLIDVRRLIESALHRIPSSAENRGGRDELNNAVLLLESMGVPREENGGVPASRAKRKESA